MDLSRRGLLASLAVTLGALGSGCTSGPGAPPTGSTSNDPAEGRETGTDVRSPAPTRTPDPDSTAGDMLPDPADSWRIESRSELQVRHVGGVTGASAEYVGPGGRRFRVIVIEREDPAGARMKAGGLYCDGWPVTVARGRFAFAAGSGTVQPTATYTPETPPHMTRSPVPGTGDDAVELLTHSPLLTEEILAGRERTCPWESGARGNRTDGG